MKLFLSFCFAFSLLACAQEDTSITTIEVDYEYEVITDQVNMPWGFDFFNDARIIITDKSGEVYLYDDGSTTKLSGFPEVYNRGQGGLLDVKIHPEYPEQPWIYFTYASTEGKAKGGHTAFARAQLTGSQLTDFEVLYKASPNTTKGVHFGSRIEFDRQGYVYISIGERGERDVNPQYISRDGGKIYRFHADGRIPNDNPFVNEDNAKKAIYSYGHRNPQGMEIHPQTGKIWVHEHGPRGGDEINIIKKAANYGWPVVTYGINYSGTSITDETQKPGMTQPIHYWVPSIAPSGMAFVNSTKYPHLNANLLVGSLKFMYLEHLELDGDKVVKREKILDKIGRVRSVEQSPDGFIYVGVEGVGLVKMLPKS